MGLAYVNPDSAWLKLLNPENPMHYMTLWTSRAFMAKHQLIQHYAAVSFDNADGRAEPFKPLAPGGTFG